MPNSTFPLELDCHQPFNFAYDLAFRSLLRHCLRPCLRPLMSKSRHRIVLPRWPNQSQPHTFAPSHLYSTKVRRYEVGIGWVAGATWTMSRFAIAGCRILTSWKPSDERDRRRVSKNSWGLEIGCTRDGKRRWDDAYNLIRHHDFPTCYICCCEFKSLQIFKTELLNYEHRHYSVRVSLIFKSTKVHA